MFQLFQRPTCPLLRDSSDFLYRRRGYVLIDMGKLDEAETEFTKMLEDEVNKEFAQRELEYIKQLRASTQS